MSSIIRNPKDFFSGAIFILFGLGALIISQDYRMGSAGNMGPAYFPSIVGALLALGGAILLARGVMTNDDTASERWAVKEGAMILGGTILFGILIRNAGLIAAVVVMVMFGGLASVKFKALPYLLMGILMAAFCALLFVVALGLPMALVGPWLGA